jgi:ketosteroid isomerase-like protein
MSQENLEGARAASEAWNAGDMDALRDLLHPDVIMRMPEGRPEPGPYVGRDAVMGEWQQLRETWDADLFEFGTRVRNTVAVYSGGRWLSGWSLRTTAT